MSAGDVTLNRESVEQIREALIATLWPENEGAEAKVRAALAVLSAPAADPQPECSCTRDGEGYEERRGCPVHDTDPLADRIAALEQAGHALAELLSVADQIVAVDPSLDSEEWYAIRDYSRIVVKRLAGAADTESET